MRGGGALLGAELEGGVVTFQKVLDALPPTAAISVLTMEGRSGRWGGEGVSWMLIDECDSAAAEVIAWGRHSMMLRLALANSALTSAKRRNSTLAAHACGLISNARVV